MREPFDGARATLNILFNLEIIIGFTTLLLTTLYLLRFNAFFGAREQKIILGHLLHFYLIGLIIILIFLGNIRLWKNLWELQTVDAHSKMFLNFWLLLNTLIFICALCTLWTLRESAPEMVTTTETALLLGIDEYYESQEWKLRWDELQIQHQCCGVNSYRDWRCAIWLSNLTEVCACTQSRAPYSCCRQDNLCSYKTYASNVGNVPMLSVFVINTNGCLAVFDNYLQRFIQWLFGVLLIGLFFQLGVWLLVNFILNNQSDRGEDYCNHNTFSSDFEKQVVCDKCELCGAARQVTWFDQ